MLCNFDGSCHSCGCRFVVDSFTGSDAAAVEDGDGPSGVLKYFWTSKKDALNRLQTYDQRSIRSGSGNLHCECCVNSCTVDEMRLYCKAC